MKKSDSCTLNVNGEEIIVWTDGNIMRIMSRGICYTEVQLIRDRNYGPDEHPIFEEYHKQAKKIREYVFGVPM
jgi:hypothetical protein